MPDQSVPQLSDVYGVFVDDINQAAAARIVGGITTALSSPGVQRIHLMFQSWGGFVGDGVMLYNFFRSLPVDLYLYNSGQIASAAVTAYLGAKHRVVSPRAMFMVHLSHNSPQFASAARMDRLAKSLVSDDERSKSIWRENFRLSDEQWSEIEHHDLHLTGEEAVKCGLATELGEFAPKAGHPIYRV